jgi:hypothetical protein
MLNEGYLQCCLGTGTRFQEKIKNFNFMTEKQKNAGLSDKVKIKQSFTRW